MANRPNHDPLDSQNPFAGGVSPYAQPLRHYPVESDNSGMYANRNASSVPLTQPGSYDESASHCKSMTGGLQSFITEFLVIYFLCAVCADDANYMRCCYHGELHIKKEVLCSNILGKCV